MNANAWFWLALTTWVTLFVWWLAGARAYLDADERELPPVAHPCALRGHTYRGQPSGWRCQSCGDFRESGVLR